MSVVGHFLEGHGIATVSVSLIRPHTETIRPPRALWVPFELGRPLGAPNNAALQGRVLQAALDLLESTDGPVILEDFPEDAPVVAADEMNGMFCPLPQPVPAVLDPDDLPELVRREMSELQPWFELACERAGGRSTARSSGLSIADSVGFLAAIVSGEPLPQPAAALGSGQALRLAAIDLRSWYLEAAVARPGQNPDSKTMNNWFWGETAAGRLLLAVHSAGWDHPDREVRRAVKLVLIPRDQAHRLPRQPG